MPDTPQDLLTQARAAFEAGHYHRVRRLTDRLLESDGDEATRLEAARLRARLKPSPLGKFLFALSFFLLISVTVFAYSR